MVEEEFRVRFRVDVASCAVPARNDTVAYFSRASQGPEMEPPRVIEPGEHLRAARGFNVAQNDRRADLLVTPGGGNMGSPVRPVPLAWCSET